MLMQTDWFYVETYFSFRYLLYDVNPGEGFNLRRDVYMRVTNLVKELNKEEPWVLVLPPWGRLYHWKSPDLEQIKIPWSTFFDLPSLREHVPVIEFEEYLKCMLSTLYIASFNMLYQFYSLCYVFVVLESWNNLAQYMVLTRRKIFALSIYTWDIDYDLQFS